jgi:PIN domain nuclease of toxin-antitoxin system
LTVVAVADTHAVLWYLFGDERLSASARAVIDRAINNGNKIAVSSITLAEVVYLIEKGRLPAVAYSELLHVMTDPGHVFAECAFSTEVVQSMRMVSRVDVPDMPDRMIAATAVFFDVPIISRDQKILAARLKTIW